MEKRNKQQLQIIQQQIEEFKNMVQEQGNQRATPGPTTVNMSSKKKNESLSSYAREIEVEQEELMETADE